MYFFFYLLQPGRYEFKKEWTKFEKITVFSQKAIAKECAEWIKRKVKFKSNTTQENKMGFLTYDETTNMTLNDYKIQAGRSCEGSWAEQ